MKKSLLAIFAILSAFSFISNAQNSNPWPTTGSVGIGTSSPGGLLHLYSSAATDMFRLQFNAGGGGNWAINPYIYGISNGGLSFVDKLNSVTPLVISSTGNVGVGTTNPSALLHTEGSEYVPSTSGSAQNSNFRIGAGSTNLVLDAGITTSGNPYCWLQSRNKGTYAANYILSLNPNGGNVGIGTTAPMAQLQVGTSTSNTGSFISMIGGAASGGAVNALSLVNSATAATGNEVNMTFHTAGNYSPTAKISAIAESVQPVTDLAFSTYNGTTGITEQMRILGNGYVGIGTSTPHEALSVNGTIRSKEVKVETANWPDYVFKPNYILPSLSFVKSYIDQNQHLPDMPSEQEITRDGLNLGEMKQSIKVKRSNYKLMN
jgi:hypothetical protein